MALINRVSQLFRADINAVLDHIEEPEQLLRQAVRDMEDELAASERRIAARAQEQEALAARRQDVVAAAGELDEQLDLCFEAGKDDLARAIIRRKLESARLGKRLDSAITAKQRNLEKERKLLEENRATLEGLRQKAEMFVCQGVSSDGGAGNDDFARLSNELRVGDDEVEIAYLREKSAREAS